MVSLFRTLDALAHLLNLKYIRRYKITCLEASRRASIMSD